MDLLAWLEFLRKRDEVARKWQKLSKEFATKEEADEIGALAYCAAFLLVS